MVKTPLEKFRKNGVFVTDLSAQLWCEKQLEFSLIHGVKKTEEMQKGAEIHENLEKEIIKTVPVEIHSVQDALAIKLDNMLKRCEQLKVEKLTREMPIIGSIDNIFITGIIDELKITKKETRIIDHKTRKSNRMPTRAQLVSTGFQIMLYKKLLDMIHQKQFTTKKLMKNYGFDKKTQISEKLIEDVKKKGLTIEKNLHQLAKKTFQKIRELPKISNKLTIKYSYQKTGKPIREHDFFYTETAFENNFNFCKEFWKGERKAIPVGEKNTWKCNFCQFKEKCKPQNKN